LQCLNTKLCQHLLHFYSLLSSLFFCILQHFLLPDHPVVCCRSDNRDCTVTSEVSSNWYAPCFYSEFCVLKRSNLGSNIIYLGRGFNCFYQTFRSTVAVITQIRKRLPFHVKSNLFHIFPRVS